MINIITGKPGSGKTYFLVYQAYKSLLAGRDVYSNFHLDFSKHKNFKKMTGKIFYWHKISDLNDLRSGDILMDEAQIYMNSRKWKDLDERFQYKLQQHRKHGLNIWGTAQNVKRIDCVARELVNSIFVVKKCGRIFVVNEFDIEEIDKAKRQSYGVKFLFLRRGFYACYDTLQEVVSV